MPVDLSEMLNPRATAVLTMEIQRNTVGDLTSLPDLVAGVPVEYGRAVIQNSLPFVKHSWQPVR